MCCDSHRVTPTAAEVRESIKAARKRVLGIDKKLSDIERILEEANAVAEVADQRYQPEVATYIGGTKVILVAESTLDPVAVGR